MAHLSHVQLFPDNQSVCWWRGRTAKSLVSLFKDNAFFNYAMVYILSGYLQNFTFYDFFFVYVVGGEVAKLSSTELIFGRNYAIQKFL